MHAVSGTQAWTTKSQTPFGQLLSRTQPLGCTQVPLRQIWPDVQSPFDVQPLVLGTQVPPTHVSPGAQSLLDMQPAMPNGTQKPKRH